MCQFLFRQSILGLVNIDSGFLWIKISSPNTYLWKKSCKVIFLAILFFCRNVPYKIALNSSWSLKMYKYKFQGMRSEFGSAGAVCSIKESSGTQNQRVHIVLKASKSVVAKGDVPKICGFAHPLHVLTHSMPVKSLYRAEM